MKIENTEIGGAHKCFVIAEIGQAHDGSLGTAHSYIDAVAKTGADAIKFQTHIAEAESTPDEKFRVRVFPQDETRFEYWKRMEFTKPQWQELHDHARESGLIFLSTPFSIEAIELLEEVGVSAWKVSSGEILNVPMLERMLKSELPILISTGMSSWFQIDEAISLIRAHAKGYGIFQCTTSYPCAPEDVGLNLIQEMKERYSCPAGLSDHSGSIFAPLAAIAQGADMIEVHAVFSKDCFGPDVSSSLTITDLAQVVEGSNAIFRMRNSPVDKDAMAESKKELMDLFSKSIYLSRDVPSGSVLTALDISVKKPGTGMPSSRLNDVIGCKLKRDYMKNEQLCEPDIEKF